MMVTRSQKTMAESFLALHQASKPFVLANSWDVASAKIFELAGFKAIGTASAALSATLGLPDGQRMTVHATAALVRRLVDKIDLPVSADIEAGYAETVEGVAATAEMVLKSGAVGINLEDSRKDNSHRLYDIEFQQDKLRAVRAMADRAGLHLVINARTDTFLIPNDDARLRVKETIERGNAYREAGADCVFVPDMGDLDLGTMKLLAREIDAPINIIAGAGTPPIAQLGEIGIARVSLGPKPLRATLGLLKKIAREILDQGTFSYMMTDAVDYAEARQMFTDK